MQKEHRILKCFMPLLACVYGFATIYCCGMIVGNDFSPLRFAASLAVEVGFIALTLWLIRRPLTRLFPQVGAYGIKCPPWHVLVLILLVTPLWCIIKGKLLYWMMPGTELKPLVYTAEELKTDLILCLSGVIVGPVYEEILFRFLPVAVYKKRSTQIVAGVLVALFFGILHTKNMFGAMMDALIFALVFIFTKNLGVSIAVHSSINLMAVVFCVLAYFGLVEIQKSTGMVMWLIGEQETLIAAAVLAVAGIVICGMRQKRIAGGAL